MATWHGPRGDCGCCGGTRCACADDPEQTSPSFTDTPTFRVVIAGMPATYEWSDFRSLGSFWHKNDWTLTGLSGINGTYFVPLEKRDLVCIDETKAAGFSDPSSFTEAFARDISVSGDICTVTSSETGTATKNLSFSGSFSFNLFNIIIQYDLSDIYAIRGEVEMFCPTYDFSESVRDNTISAFGASRTWPRSSGEIKIFRRAISTTDCGYTLEHASGQVFATIGTIAVDLINVV